MTKILTTPEFSKDVKKLTKKYNSISDDINTFLQALKINLPDKLRDTVRISGLGEKYSNFTVYKVRSFRCKSMFGKGSRSGIRVIYEYCSTTDTIGLIQIYSHSQNVSNHDIGRIHSYLDGKISEGFHPGVMDPLQNISVDIIPPVIAEAQRDAYIIPPIIATAESQGDVYTCFPPSPDSTIPNIEDDFRENN
ncbi:hypothetical protein SDC9_20414 [bioreactor metagenome]|uniref:Uncharacterized protein n=1 Tax=bioreactor metagenome TaxID=1076179 RepID=A0A644U6P4_9ZZZZ|nr:hypothetical protein [Methanocorpusculum sp.]